MKEIKLSSVKYPGKVALVSDEDYEEVSKHTWSVLKDTHTFYATCSNSKITEGRSSIKMHRFILKIYDPEIKVDHANNNGLDNQRHNIRIANHSQNMANREGRGESKYMGVYKPLHRNTYKKWGAICQKGNTIYQKRFYTEIEAALAYNEWAKELHGEFAKLNIISQKEIEQDRLYKSTLEISCRDILPTHITEKKKGKYGKKYRVQIVQKGKNYNGGSYSLLEDAIIAVEQLKQKLNGNRNHEEEKGETCL